jgi:hypothetical protein
MTAENHFIGKTSFLKIHQKKMAYLMQGNKCLIERQ